MEGKAIVVGDKFELESGVFAECPGKSGTARNDINCRCFLEYKIVSVEEAAELTGKSVEEVRKIANITKAEEKEKVVESKESKEKAERVVKNNKEATENKENNEKSDRKVVEATKSKEKADGKDKKATENDEKVIENTEKVTENKEKAVEKAEKSGIIGIEDEHLQKQLAYVYNGEKNFIPNNTIIDTSKIIAGFGSNIELRIANQLANTYGGDANRWEKKVGKVESAKYIFDIHWYEYAGKQYEMKLKHRKMRM